MAANRVALRDELSADGYSKEEAYFYDLNRELIESRRKRLDAERAAQQALQQGTQHWMTCPRCGSEMKGTALSEIRFDQCSGCKGIFFEPGEFETLLKTREQKSFLHAFWEKIKLDLSRPDVSWRP
jgi:Zn-finger nucleic acid-binding protein